MATLQHKYSLWLSPPKHSPAHASIQSLIAQFSTAPDSPVFPPHLTLFSPVRTDSDAAAIEQVQFYVAKLRERQLSQIPIEIRKVASGSKFYQCIMLEVGGVHEDAVRSANTIAREHWDATGQPNYYPHVSLVYRECTAEQREQLKEAVEMAMPANIGSLAYVADEVRIIETVGLCNEWRDIGSISLATGQHSAA
ncbi:hypothetical protein EC988_000891 [Linderina pennispora]|nr:hypothetical protein EC988_000891 [Linderina pennispora]